MYAHCSLDASQKVTPTPTIKAQLTGYCSASYSVSRIFGRKFVSNQQEKGWLCHPLLFLRNKNDLAHLLTRLHHGVRFIGFFQRESGMNQGTHLPCFQQRPDSRFQRLRQLRLELYRTRTQG